MRCAGRCADGRVLNGAANLGIRPSFDPPNELLEPYFFDFAGDLYGQTIEVALIEFLRPEAKFDDLEALKAQMAQDCDRGAGDPAADVPPRGVGPTDPRLRRDTLCGSRTSAKRRAK